MNGIRTHTENPTDSVIDDCLAFLQDRAYDDIGTALQQGDEAVTIQYSDLATYDIDLADALIDRPREILEAFRIAITEVEVPVPGAEDDLQTMDVRIGGVDDIDPIVSELRNDHHLGRYIGLRG